MDPIKRALEIVKDSKSLKEFEEYLDYKEAQIIAILEKQKKKGGKNEKSIYFDEIKKLNLSAKREKLMKSFYPVNKPVHLSKMKSESGSKAIYSLIRDTNISIEPSNIKIIKVKGEDGWYRLTPIKSF